jgi:hypothetical protein
VRRTLLIGVSVLAVAFAAVAATRSSTLAATQPTRQADCRQSLVIVLFWPKGHSAIGSVGMAANHKPHLEIYKYSKNGYPGKNLLVAGNASGDTHFSKICKFASGPGPSGAIANRLTLTKARALSCRIPTGGFERTKPVKGGLQIDLGSPQTRVLSAKLHKRGSTLDYSHAWCNAGKPPS